ncbi:hypothetical protein [Bacteroides gallinarum]|uniref:hypothetical protein n=1 Tax=Bacteroides gallinarum TaxID=376806 RepID=UPI000469A4DE|nr:hypothetical protein [Bacteroides gallinarum]
MRNNPVLIYIWLLIIGYGCVSTLCVHFVNISTAMIYTGYGILILWILYTLVLANKKRKDKTFISNGILIGAVIVIAIAFGLLFQNKELIGNHISNHHSAYYISSWVVFILFLIINWIYVQQHLKKTHNK